MALSRSPFTRIGLARLAAVPLLLTGILCASPAARAERVIVDPDYMETVGEGCIQSTFCIVPFTKVPRGQVLLVERVTCRFGVGDAKINFAYLMRQANNGGLTGPITHLLPALRVGADNDGIQSNDSARHVFKSGQIPAVSAGVAAPADKFGSATCSIFGTLRDEGVR